MQAHPALEARQGTRRRQRRASVLALLTQILKSQRPSKFTLSNYRHYLWEFSHRLRCMLPVLPHASEIGCQEGGREARGVSGERASAQER
jgi:hypothetical protein